MKTLIKALLGASLLLPATAQAQQDDRRGRRAEMRGERPDRPDRPARTGRFEGRAPIQAQPDAPAATPPAPQTREARREGGRFGAGFQARAETQPQAQPQVQPQPQPRAFGAGGREQRRSALRQGFGQQPGQIRAPDNRGGYDRDRRDARQDYRTDRRDDRSNVVRDQQRRQRDRDNAYGNRNGFGTSFGGGNSYTQRQGWNRGWRNDNRYDWNRYRSGNSSLYRLPRYYAPNGWGNGYRRFSIGITLSSLLWDQDYWIDDPWSYRLPEAYGPYRWVRYYDDALLIDIRSGQVVDTVYDIFY